MANEASLVGMRKKREEDIEPLATQEWIARAFKATSNRLGYRPEDKEGAALDRRADRYDRKMRRDAILDLRRVPGDAAADFRHDNPDADIHDWERYRQYYENR